MCYIYKISNKVNKFVYIGQTMREPQKRWAEHLKSAETKKNRLYKAMRKHGIENFSFEVIDTIECDGLDTQNICFIVEKVHIKCNNAYWFGYNDTIGGKGFWFNRPKRGRKKKA